MEHGICDMFATDIKDWEYIYIFLYLIYQVPGLMNNRGFYDRKVLRFILSKPDAI